MILVLKRSRFLGVFVFLLLLFSCSKDTPDPIIPVNPGNPDPPDPPTHTIIPAPVSIELEEDAFELSSSTRFLINAPSEVMLKAYRDFLDLLIRSTGFTNLEVSPTDDLDPSGEDYIFLMVEGSNSTLGEEGYEMEITDAGIKINAKSDAGLYYGLQSLRLMLPATIEAKTPQAENWLVPKGKITDYPQYAYRGAMLDVARHFFTPEEVKRYIDLISLYKINTLHLHLTDDQGWRIEIKSWPNLTTIGGSSEVGGGPGGFYTQDEYIEIVNYAAEHFITLIPEIDMPGHTHAALASYPELNCDGMAPPLYTGTDVGFSSLCTTKEDITIGFVDDVIGEIAAITPGRYIHIGGNESDVTGDAEYINFISTVSEIVQSYDKQLIGWDDIAAARSNLTGEPGVQFWINPDNVQLAVQTGNAKIIFSPIDRTYLNLKYTPDSPVGADFGFYLSVQSAYTWNLISPLPTLPENRIWGVEAPLWTETVATMEDIEFLAFPRLIAIAEVAWMEARKLNWEDFRQRLGKYKQRLDLLGVNYYASPLVPWEN